MIFDGKQVTHLTHDSRDVREGSLFFSLRGTYVTEALAKGAVGVVTEDARRQMALISKEFYDNACDKMKIVGITGTNGKTTTTHIISHILRANKIKVESIGTLGPTPLTTPDPIELHALFKQFYEEGVQVVVMECSAHAIHLEKLAGITFEVGVFTNLSQDHLDFFPDYRAYADTKTKWFDENMKSAVINIDDEESTNIHHKNIIPYSFDEKIKFRSPLLGRFNHYNCLAAIKVCQQLGLPMRKIKRALRTVPPVPGRFSTVTVNGKTVVVDYAHTPDSLENIIKACRDLAGDKGHIITVFGCGGERDVSKRPLMGAVSSQLSDYTIITSDNPRGEPPRSIMLQIEAGAKLHSANYKLIADRKEAIYHALDMAKPGDIVIVAGKGAEDYMDIGGKKISYSDHGVICEYKSKFDKQ